MKQMRKVRFDLKKICFFKEKPRLNCTLYSIVTHHLSVIALGGLLKIVKKKRQKPYQGPQKGKREQVQELQQKQTNQQTKRKPPNVFILRI